MSDARSVPNPGAKPAIPFIGGPAIKLALIGVLLLLMQIPVLWVSSLVDERQDRQSEVQADIGRSWGPPQAVLGPIMVVPFRAEEPQPRLVDGRVQPPLPVRGYVHVMPNRLSADARIAPERRKRGLFGAVVYTGQIGMTGTFNVPTLNVTSLSGGDLRNVELLWPEAYVVAGATGLRATDPDTPLQFDNRRLDPAEDAPSMGDGCPGGSLLRWNLGLDGSPAGRAIPFETTLALRGASSLHLIPAARRVELSLFGAWGTPSFSGSVLPTASNVTDAEFKAEWRDIGGAQQSVWTSRTAMSCANAQATMQQQIGVDLLEAVPTYRMVTRSTKYAILFMALAFLTYFLFETLTRRPIHLVQYGMLGLSLSLFALLLLAVAEPLGFAPAYAIATAMVVGQASAYTWLVTRHARLAAVFAGVLGLLFGFLYVVLNLESYSLLAGAVALFAVLSVVMVVTNRLDWSGRAA